MGEYKYAKGRIAGSIQFISAEMREFEEEYADKQKGEYEGDKKLQKLIDRTVENILTALIEVCGTVLAEKGVSAESYSDVLRKCCQRFEFSDNEQNSLAGLSVQRNRLAHRYLNFRWQAIKMFAEQKALVLKLIQRILQREEKEKQVLYRSMERDGTILKGVPIVWMPEGAEFANG
jgi:uncharacterized protein YutE (UPF0331/DUF86 family)